jgi:hypothetical protein
LRERGRRTLRLLRTLAVVVGIIAGYLAVRDLFRFLAFMVAGGSGPLTFTPSSTVPGNLGVVELCLAVASVVLLVWIPNVFFNIQLDISGTGDAQRVLLGLITATACTMTGTAFLLLHFGDGPLHNIRVGTLVIGIIGTVLLVANPYRSLARACWRRGIAGVFHPRTLKQHWENMATELGKALDNAAERDSIPSSAPGYGARQPGTDPER